MFAGAETVSIDVGATGIVILGALSEAVSPSLLTITSPTVPVKPPKLIPVSVDMHDEDPGSRKRKDGSGITSKLGG